MGAWVLFVIAVTAGTVVAIDVPLDTFVSRALLGIGVRRRLGRELPPVEIDPKRQWYLTVGVSVCVAIVVTTIQASLHWFQGSSWPFVAFVGSLILALIVGFFLIRSTGARMAPLLLGGALVAFAPVAGLVGGPVPFDEAAVTYSMLVATLFVAGGGVVALGRRQGYWQLEQPA